MTLVLGCLLLLIVALVAVPVLILLVQVLAALAPGRRVAAIAGARPRVAVLIPAHDESAGIARVLAAIVPQLCESDRLLVVADNCSDNTALAAASAGAEVIERRDAVHRGKGYALDHGIRHLEADPPEILLIVDADCDIVPGAIDRIARLSALTQRPVQASYLIKSPNPAIATAAIAEFAQLVKNFVRPLGFMRLGLPCQLMGTGMAFPWSLIRSMPLASGHLVEDLKLGIDCARAGSPPLFCPEAQVLGHFPTNAEGTQSQRVRWEHGHLGMIFGEAPRLLMDSLRSGMPAMLMLVVDMCIPPLALLSMAVLATFGLAAAFYFAFDDAVPLCIASLSLSGFAVAIAAAWLGFGQRVVSIARLACAPLYVAGKLPLYLKFVVRRQVEWVRSRRDEG